MDKIDIKKNHISLITIIFVMFFVAIFAIGSTFAWFTDENNLTSEDEVAAIEMQILNGSNEIIAVAPTFTYQGAGTQTCIIKVKSSAISTINSIVRIMVVGTWSDGLQVYTSETGNTVTYSYNTTDWSEKAIGDIGFNYVYKDIILTGGETSSFLNSITFPTLPEEYIGAVLTLSVYAEGLQANSAGVALWSSVAPTGWNPLGA